MKKAAYSRKLFARLTKSQGANKSILEKLLRNIDRDIGSNDLDVKKLATDSIFKLLPYVMPRESNGSQFNLQINNNNGDSKNSPENVVLGLKEFLIQKKEQIKDVEYRRDMKAGVELKEIGTIEKKDGHP